MLCYPLDIHKMSGVLFAEAWVFGEAFLPKANAGRGDRPGVRSGLGLFDDFSSGFGAGFGNRQFWSGLSADLRERSFRQGPRRTRHLHAKGQQWGRRSHRQDDGISVVPFQVNAAVERARLRA